jgi:hypothetical protein
MRRRQFFQAAGAAALASGFGTRRARGVVPSRNWDKYDFGSPVDAKDRLYQGPFPQYPPEKVLPCSSVDMTTLPSREIVPNCGMGLTVYVSGDFWPLRTRGDTLEKYCEDLISLQLDAQTGLAPGRNVPVALERLFEFGTLGLEFRHTAGALARRLVRRGPGWLCAAG